MRGKSLLKAAVLLAAAGVAAYFALYNSGRTEDTSVITAYGNVELRQVQLGFRVGGRIASMDIEEGQEVAAGETVAALETRIYENAASMARARVAASQANFAKLTKGYRAEEIAAGTAQAASVRYELHMYEKEYVRTAELYEKHAVPKQQLDDITGARDATAAKLEAALQNQKMLTAGFRREDVRAAAAALDESLAGLASALSDLSDTKITAPSGGVMITRVMEPGAVVNPGMPVYVLSLKSPRLVRAYVSETALGLLAYGMECLVYTDSYPKGPLHGKLSFISPESEFTPKQVQTEELRPSLVYRIQVTVSDGTGILKNGMPVTVKIDTSRAISKDSEAAPR